jgi:transposase-like protein
MTSFGEPDGDCQASSKVSLALLSKSLPFLLTANMAIRKYQKTAPKLAAWLPTNAPDGLSVFALPATHRRRLRTSNLLERLNKEIKRRTRVATLFPNEAALVRLVSAVLMEISEEWETEKIYLRMENSGLITQEE